jgi:putative membrane protein
MKRITAALAALLLFSFLASGEEAKASLSKDETVYAILDPSGAVKSLTVSDWVHSTQKGSEIRDRSDLSNIENVKGKEVPKRVGSELVWPLAGGDVYYRGTSTKSLPFAVKISYWLDDKRVEASGLAGKSGKVRIRIEVKNLAASKAAAPDSEKRVYAPLAVIVGTNLPGSVFSDIEIKGGNLISDGQNNIVAGVLLPGLLESIIAASSPQGAKGIEELPDSVKKLVPGDTLEITARVAKFSFGSFMVAASPSLPDFGDLDAIEKLQSALDGLKQLGEGSAAIRSGSAALADGAAQLRAAIAPAIAAAKPFFQNNASIESAKAFIGSDEDVAAARSMLAAGERLSTAGPEIKSMLSDLLNPATKAGIAKLLADAKAVDTKALLDAPLAGSVVSESNLAAMAESIRASDELYAGFDEAKLAALADFAEGSPALFTALRSFDEAASGYSPEAGAAIASLAGAKLSFESASAKASRLGSYDAAAAATALEASGRAQGDFIARTSFLDDSLAVSALQAKLGSGAELTKEERAALASLLGAASSGRAEAKAGVQAQATAAKALVAYADAAALLPRGLAAAKASEELQAKTLPALAAAKEAHGATKGAVQAAVKTFNPKAIATISTNVHKIGAAKKAYAKMKPTIKLANTFLAIKAGQGGFKKQMAALEDLQKDAAALGPLMDKATGLLESGALASVLGPPDQAEAQLYALMGDIERLSKYFGLCKDFLSEKSVGQARALVAKMPELEAGIDQLDSGTSLLAEKLGELAAGTATFDDTGIKPLVGEVGGLGRMALGYLKATDAVAAVAKDYRIFSQAPAGAKTSLKYILRTEEIK